MARIGSTIDSTGSISTAAVNSSLSGRWNSSVSITPGFTTCTRTFEPAMPRSTFIDSDHAVIAAFDAAYAASAGGPRRAATDEMFTMRPPRARCRAAARA